MKSLSIGFAAIFAAFVAAAGVALAQGSWPENEERPLILSYWLERHVGGRQGVFEVDSSYEFCHGDRVGIVLSADRPARVSAWWRPTPSGESEAPDASAEIGEKTANVGMERWRPLLSGAGKTMPSGGELRLPTSGPIVLGNRAEDLEVALVFAPETSGSTARMWPTQGIGKTLPTPRLVRRWAPWFQNAELGPGARVGRSEASGLDPSLPAAVELVIRHLPCNRRQSLPSLTSAHSEGAR